MLRLYGFPVSHYYNMVKHVLLVKGVAFEEEFVLLGAEGYVEKSPVGKIPCIGVEEGYLSETSSILEYIEDSYPEPRLVPAESWRKAKMRELMKISELYIEAPARQLIPVVMEQERDNEGHLKAIETLNKGLHAIARLANFNPYLMGEDMTLADVMFRYVLIVVRGHAALPQLVTARSVGIDIASVLPGLADWDAAMGESPVSQSIDALLVEKMPAFLGKSNG